MGGMAKAALSALREALKDPSASLCVDAALALGQIKPHSQPRAGAETRYDPGVPGVEPAGGFAAGCPKFSIAKAPA